MGDADLVAVLAQEERKVERARHPVAQRALLGRQVGDRLEQLLHVEYRAHLDERSCHLAPAVDLEVVDRAGGHDDRLAGHCHDRAQPAPEADPPREHREALLLDRMHGGPLRLAARSSAVRGRRLAVLGVSQGADRDRGSGAARCQKWADDEPQGAPAKWSVRDSVGMQLLALPAWAGLLPRARARQVPRTRRLAARANYALVGENPTPTGARAARGAWLDPAEQFPLLYEQEYHNVYRTVRAIVLDRTEAEDLTQECFARAYRARDKYLPDAPPGAWVHRIAVNTAISHLRRRRLAKFLPLKMEQGAPDRDLARAEARSALEEAMADLSPKLRAAVVLQYYEDRSRDEIAEILGIPSGTVASRVAKAMSLMRASMSEQMAGMEPDETLPGAHEVRAR